MLLTLAAAVLFIEEWGWRPLTAWAARVARWPPLARAEARIRRVSPRLALALFLVPAVALFPIKLIALWLIHVGQVALGVTAIVVAKLLGTAFVGRLFLLTESQLMTFPWFVTAWTWWRATKARVMAACRRSSAWQGVARMRVRVKLWLRRMRRQRPG